MAALIPVDRSVALDTSAQVLGDALIPSLSPQEQINLLARYMLDFKSESSKDIRTLKAEVRRLRDNCDVLSQALQAEQENTIRLRDNCDALSQTLQVEQENAIETAREKWVQSNTDLAKAYIIGTGLGVFGSAMVMGGVAATLGMVPAPLALTVLTTGMTKGQSTVRKLDEENLKDNLKARERDYLSSHPGASKREAFEHAKVAIKESQKNAAHDDPDSWSGLDYSI